MMRALRLAVVCILFPVVFAGACEKKERGACYYQVNYGIGYYYVDTDKCENGLTMSNCFEKHDGFNVVVDRWEKFGCCDASEVDSVAGGCENWEEQFEPDDDDEEERQGCWRWGSLVPCEPDEQGESHYDSYSDEPLDALAWTELTDGPLTELPDTVDDAIPGLTELPETSWPDDVQPADQTSGELGTPDSNTYPDIDE